MHELIIHAPVVRADEKDKKFIEAIGGFQNWLVELAGGFNIYQTIFAWRDIETGALHSTNVMRYIVPIREDVNMEGVKMSIRAWGLAIGQVAMYCVIRGEVVIIDCSHPPAWFNESNTKH